tara:strand:- start:1545 stop:2276 length:732 start_codon:yes stop_codon:yes gene_type:complete
MRNLTITLIGFVFAQNASASFFRDACRHLEDPNSVLNEVQIRELKKDNRVVEHESIKSLTTQEYSKYIGDFFTELCKVPYAHRKLVKRRGLETHLVAGSISLHPYIQSLTVGPRGHTTNWDPIPGVAAVSKQGPSVINIKSLYANHGSKNLVIHEFGHVLDQFFNAYDNTFFDISPSPTFVELSKDSPWMQIYGAFLVPYHKENPEEHFAELYARWYGAEESRAQIRALIPGIEAFFDSLLLP